MAREPRLNEWKLSPEKRRRPSITAETPLSIPDAPLPGEAPAALAPVPTLYPAGPTEFAYLYGLIDTLDQGAVSAAGDTMSGTLRIDAEPSAALNLQNRYTFITDNAGTPGHEVSGPNLTIHDVAKNHDPVKLLSIGQVQINLKDSSLADNAVAHGLQVRRQAGVAGGASVGFGTGIQFFAPGTNDVEVEVGNIQAELTSVTPGAVGSGLRFRAMLAGTNTEVFRSNSAGNMLASGKLLATGGLGAGNSAAATTLASPGTVTKRLEVFDTNGNSLGSVPIYANGSFS